MNEPIFEKTLVVVEMCKNDRLHLLATKELNDTAARLAAAERLKVAASKAAEALYELGHDAYNDLAMALVDFERANGEIK